MLQCPHPYRVFVSYAREDQQKARKVLGLLRDMGARPLSDENIDAGHKFPEEIKRLIEQSHALLVVLTERSVRSSWVQQELAYAHAIRLPIVLLAASDHAPEGFLTLFQTTRVNKSLSDLRIKFTAEALTKLIEPKGQTLLKLPGWFEYASERQFRSNTLNEYYDRSEYFMPCGRLRHEAILSSFSIPNKPLRHQDWQHKHLAPDDATNAALLAERQHLEQYVAMNGCNMIIHPDTPTPDPRESQLIRLRTLEEFLDSMADDKVNVIVRRKATATRNVLIVGDWFMAEAIVPPRSAKGYNLTVFTRHAPTVLFRAKAFDAEFKDEHQAFLEAEGRGGSSRQAALRIIRGMLTNVQPSSTGRRKRAKDGSATR
jgi:hypothetical protein